MSEYFELAGVLFVIYVAIRVAIASSFGVIPSKEADWKAKEAGTGIDASKLSGRMEQLRKDMHVPVEKPASFKKPLMVEEKRREMEKLAFFQKQPPTPEPPEQEAGMGLGLLLI